MLWKMQMLQDLQWDGCRKETDYYEKSYGSRRNSNFRDTQVDIKDNSWSVGTQKPDALAQSVLEKEFKVPAKYLFPEAS